MTARTVQQRHRKAGTKNARGLAVGKHLEEYNRERRAYFKPRKLADVRDALAWGVSEEFQMKIIPKYLNDEPLN